MKYILLFAMILPLHALTFVPVKGTGFAQKGKSKNTLIAKRATKGKSRFWRVC